MFWFKIKQKRLDTSDEFYDFFTSRDITLKKYIELLEVKSINNPNIITIVVNPKEYFELFLNKKFNKNIKELEQILAG